MAAKEQLVIASISSGGSTIRAVHEETKPDGYLSRSRVDLVIVRSDNAVGKAVSNGIPQERVVKVDPQDYPTPDDYAEALDNVLRPRQPDVVPLLGFDRRIPSGVIDRYRMFNQHPAPLDPGRGNDFGGKGMFGLRPHIARVAYAWMTGDEYELWTEATTHHVTSEYDQGNLIRANQIEIPPLGRSVTPTELIDNPGELMNTARMVQATLLPYEHGNVIATLKHYQEGREIPSFRRNEALVPPERHSLLQDAMRVAKKVFPNP